MEAVPAGVCNEVGQGIFRRLEIAAVWTPDAMATYQRAKRKRADAQGCWGEVYDGISKTIRRTSGLQYAPTPSQVAHRGGVDGGWNGRTTPACCVHSAIRLWRLGVGLNCRADAEGKMDDS